LNLFAISYYAPPQLTPQAIQIGRQLYYLNAAVTLLHGHDGQFAEGFDQYPDFFQRIERLRVENPGPWLKGRAHRLAQRLLPLYGNCPDALRPWRHVAAQRARRDMRTVRPDALVSFGMPMSDHLLALALRRDTGLPWVAHFSDPWADNPFHETSALEQRVNAWQERRVIKAADALIFTSARTLDLVMGKYPDAWRSKAAVVPHAWDMRNVPHTGPDHALPPGVRHVVRYIGACYGARSPAPLFAALRQLVDEQPDLLDGVLFEFVGHMSPQFRALPDLQALPQGLVRIGGSVDYLTSLQLARQASALLVIDAPSRDGRPSVFLPSKLVEYIGARRPVWGITPPGTSADLIAEWAPGVPASAPPDDIHAIAAVLRHGLAALADERPGYAPGSQYGPDAVAERFAPERVAGQLLDHIRAVVSRQRGTAEQAHAPR
jgi:hypothetical protein